MIGLAYLLAAIVFLMVLGAAVSIAWRRGMKRGSRKRAWAYATIAFLAVYLPVFWDHIPTVLAHRYYCAKDGGLTVYKDPKVWLAEHKDELESLRVKPGGESVNQVLSDGWERSHLINKVAVIDHRISRPIFLPGIDLWREATRLVDLQNNDILAINIGYGTYRGFAAGGIKVWLYRNGCDQGSSRRFGEVWAAYSIYEQIGETK